MLYLLFFAQIIIIYLVSQKTIQKIFTAFFRVIRSSRVSGYIVALLFLPGTALHELSHFLMAVALLLNVKELNLIPKTTKEEHGGYYIKLGSVTYEQKDFFRSILVGVAPFFTGLGFLFFIFNGNFFPHTDWKINIIIVYLLYSTTSSMFSSRKDLEGAIILVPLFILIFSLLIGFKIDLQNLFFSEKALDFMQKMNLYLAWATIGNTLVYTLLRLVKI